MREVKFRIYNGESIEEIIIDFNTDKEAKHKEFYIYPNDVFMQYTGLKDKNGKELYEGDIIGFDMDTFYKRIFTVIYDSGRFGIQTDEGFRCLSDWIIIQKDNNTISCEVIGNIYEHKHLIK